MGQKKLKQLNKRKLKPVKAYLKQFNNKLHFSNIKNT